MIFFIKNKKKTCVISKSRYNIIEVKEYTRVITMYIFCGKTSMRQNIICHKVVDELLDIN